MYPSSLCPCPCDASCPSWWCAGSQIKQAALIKAKNTRLPPESDADLRPISYMLVTKAVPLLSLSEEPWLQNGKLISLADHTLLRDIEGILEEEEQVNLNLVPPAPLHYAFRK